MGLANYETQSHIQQQKQQQQKQQKSSTRICVSIINL
jgi:hypothetical protein